MVYVLTCNVCQIQYVGETEQVLAARMNGHKRGIRAGSTEEYLHFNCDDEHRRVDIHNKFKIQIAEKIFDNDEVNNKKAKERRLQREAAWTFRLQTVFPLGLNSRIKGIGSVNQEGGCKPFNHFVLSSGFDKNLKKKKRNWRRISRRATQQELQLFIETLRAVELSQALKLIRGKSQEFLIRS